MVKSVSMVVIGRNDSDKLEQIYTIEYMGVLKNYIQDFVYVDSKSDDNSIEIMQKLGFRIVIISNTEACCAAAGRHLGTLKAVGEYVLYLDSDMELHDPNLAMKKISDLVESKDSFFGCVGIVKDKYPLGGERIRVRKVNDDGVASSFGGGVLLRREAVIEVGNWNYNLLANEELDLQIRLEINGYYVNHIEEILIVHHTRNPSRIHELLALYIPGVSNRYGSWGQLAKSQDTFRNTWVLAKKNREVIFLILLPLVFSISGWLGLIWLAIYEIDLTRRRSVFYNFVVPGVALSFLIGLFFIPRRSVSLSYEEI